ncbi:MAG: DegT/DnrJ/EryC1/StrS family aminotransferase [Anaerolineaceae bacterium]|nr:DegT/DnrJ/EryC1/StrS family aminotransferase [Anaerolineaceae bacterium]
MRENIKLAKPWITQKEIDYVIDALQNAWHDDYYTYHERFESAFSEYIGVKYAITLPSRTAAIHLALLALDIGTGDEVIVPETTNFATAAPVKLVGATPVFADIDPRTWCMSADSFKRNISSKTKAVIPVAIYGNLPDWDAIQNTASRRGIKIIEDAAQAIGSEYRGRLSGSFGDASVFSFNHENIVSTGEGGMLLTDQDEFYKRIELIRDYGFLPEGRRLWKTEADFRYKMSNIQAALGLAQFERLPDLLARKLDIFCWYQEELAGSEGLTLNYEVLTTRSTYFMVTAIMDPSLGFTKEAMIEELRLRNIEARPFFDPLSSHPVFQRLKPARIAQQENNISYQLSPYGINLPCALSMTEDDVHFVCDEFREILFNQD